MICVNEATELLTTIEKGWGDIYFIENLLFLEYNESSTKTLRPNDHFFYTKKKKKYWHNTHLQQ